MWFDGSISLHSSGLLVVAALMAAALMLDHLLGEPARFHPLVGFGNWANMVERRCRAFTVISLRLRGMVAWALTVILTGVMAYGLFAWLLELSLGLWLTANAVVLYLTIGGNSLVLHALAIYTQAT